MALPIRLPNLGPRARLALRIVGYIALALVTFVFALQLTFPYDRVKARIEDALSSKYDVSIASVERGWLPGRVYFESITLRTRAAKPEEQAQIYIPMLEVNLGLLALIGGTASVDLDATMTGSGRLRGNVSISKASTEIDFEGSHLQAELLPLHELVGLPASGTLDLEFKLALPNEKQKSGKVATNWQKAAGHIQLACPGGCTIGDGKSKLKTKLKNSRSQAMVGDGLPFGKVHINSLLATVEIGDGKLALTKFEAPSDDGTLQIDYQMDLEPSFDESAVTGCLRFTGSQSLLKREQKTFDTFTLIGGALGPDNLFHVRLTDTFKNMRKLGQVCSGAGAEGNGSSGSGTTVKNGKGRATPNLTVQPPDEAGRGADGMRPVPNFTPPSGVAPAAIDGGITVPIPGPDEPGPARTPPDGSAGSGSAGSGSSHSGSAAEGGSGSAGSGEVPVIN